MRRIFASATLLAALAFPAAAQDASAVAAMKGPDGTDLGTVTITETKSGMLNFFIEMTGVPAGAHGFHVHGVGKCDGPTFETAGGHLTGGKTHGFNAEGGPHAGDFPNVHAGQDGLIKAEFFSDRLNLGTDATGLMDGDGSAVMLHVGPDDYITDPSGHSGGRIACGIVQQP